MALNKLSEKLDQLSGQELGFEFDDAAVWSKLEQRMDNKRTRPYWWVVAACLLAGLTFLPLGRLENTTQEEQVISGNVEKIVEGTPLQDELEKKEVQVAEYAKEEFKTLSKKEFVPVETAKIPALKLAMEPIAVTEKKENYKSAFAAEDISIIQASLEQSSIEKGRTMTIRAQWQKSTEELNVNYQALKIKLYEKEKKQ